MSTTFEPQVVCQPNTPEWLAARLTGIGSSEAAAAAGLSEWRTPLEVYYKKRGELKINLDDVAAVRLGHLLEPVVVQEFCTMTGSNLVQYPLPMCRHPVHSFVLATGDALLDYGEGLEAKTTTWRMAARLGVEGTDDIPVDWICQVNQAMAVYGWPSVWVAVLIDGRTLRNFRLERNDDLIEGLIDAERELWERIQAADPPEPDWTHPRTPQLIRQIYKSVTPGKRVTFSAEMVEAQRRYEEIAQQVKAFDAEQKLIRAKQIVEMGDAEGGFLGGGKMLRMKVVNRAGYTVKPSEYVDCRVVKADGQTFEPTTLEEIPDIAARFRAVQELLLAKGYLLREQSHSGSCYYVALGRPDVRVSDHPPNAATARYLLKSGGMSIRVDAELWDLQTIEASLLN